ncbi:MAG: hypothetical protein AB7P99_02925 [Vicinamibacterales bacterium]
MRIALSLVHFAGLRNFEPVVRELAARGHAVHLSAEEEDRLGGEALARRLADEYPAITWDYVPPFDAEPAHLTASALRVGLDLVRFSDRRYGDSPKLRRRYGERAPRLVHGMLAVLGPARSQRLLTRVEQLLPRSSAGDAYWRAHAPDVLLLTGLTFSRSRQLDHLKSARALGIPVGACIASWDHLSSKALVHIAPDMVIVWNDVQVREAVDLHGLPAERLVATGAQCYDAWFGRTPDRSREEFCRAMGLRADRPFVLYVCSALTPSPEPPEPEFIKQWIATLRREPALRDVGVLVRPHPERLREWNDVTLDGLEQVAFYGSNPIDADAKRDYFDSLYYSSAVVGIVTSSFLEACIVGRPILTVLVPEYRSHQEEMAHFQYLLTVDGGILQTAATLEEHARQLNAAIAQQGRDERNRRFLTTFVRPAGLDTPATPPFADAVERLGASSPSSDRTLEDAPRLRGVVARLATALGASDAGRWLLMDERDVESARIERQKDRARARREAAFEARQRAELADRDARLRAKAKQRSAKSRRHVWRQLRHDVAVFYRRGREGVARLAHRALGGGT